MVALSPAIETRQFRRLGIDDHEGDRAILSDQANTRVLQKAATRAALVSAARRLFADKGYHGTGTHDLVVLAGVTRGALYRHFRDKDAIFEEVFRQVELDFLRQAAEPVLALANDPWLQLMEGVQSFLDAIVGNAEVQRILLIDGPAVLGWKKWRQLKAEFTLGYLHKSLDQIVSKDGLEEKPVGAMAQLIFAALNEAALLIAHSEFPSLTKIEVGEALHVLISGIR
jgi:AcrR family transcriptional regulator